MDECCNVNVIVTTQHNAGTYPYTEAKQSELVLSANDYLCPM